jgi:micrococcal nuclease
MRQRNMKKLMGLIAALVLACISLYEARTQIYATGGTQVAAVASSTARASYAVTKVVDGDTLKLSMDGKTVTVRLIGLDTPEIVDPRTPVQCFGLEASEKAKEMLKGASVRIEQDATQSTYDKYGRLLAYVYLKDGTLFNEYMIREGYGHEYTYDAPYKHQREFKAAEMRARAQGKGLWGRGICEL